MWRARCAMGLQKAKENATDRSCRAVLHLYSSSRGHDEGALGTGSLCESPQL